MKALIVDDEAIARRRLRRLLSEIDFVESCIEARDTEEAARVIASDAPDVLLLDISMPGQDGVSFARANNLPPVIFTTAHPQYAVDAFEVRAVDYLLKPIGKERLLAALARVPIEVEQQAAGRLIVTRRGQCHFVDPLEVTRFWSSGKLTSFVHRGTEHLLEVSLDALEERLEGFGFFRSHRGELIRLDAVESLRSDENQSYVELIDGQRAKVSRRLATFKSLSRARSRM